MSPKVYAFLADVVLLLHVSFAAYIVLGFAVIWLGKLFRWGFVTNRWFRGTHLAAMGIVVMESLAGWFCPLTTWEYDLRLLAGQGRTYEKSFMSHWAERIFYHDVSESTFTVIYVVFFLLLVATMLFIPVRWRGHSSQHP
ncbi:MAG: DUF2784 domain-containing protein [Desulfovibrio sp.]|nr:MAG: DUF2784 domain-containing protein [Desulfovibrio sp.]